MEHFLSHIGYLAIFVIAFVEAVCIPFPSEVTFGYTASLAAQGHDFTLWLIIVVGVIGEICGSLFAYALGKSGGRAFVGRYGKYVLLGQRDLDKADAFMARRGAPSVLIGRMIPLLRAFISLVAGIGEMPFARFAISTAVGTTIYCSALAVIGYELGGEWHKIVKGFTAASIIVLVLVVAGIAFRVFHKIRELRAEQARG
jgi:membrane protein DedA with SNARE-associated domain